MGIDNEEDTGVAGGERLKKKRVPESPTMVHPSRQAVLTDDIFEDTKSEGTKVISTMVTSGISVGDIPEWCRVDGGRQWWRCRNRITGVSRIIDRHEDLYTSGKQ